MKGLGFVTKMFGGGDLVKDVMGAVDDNIWSNEERADWYIKYLDSTSGQNLARRYLMFIVTAVWAFASVNLAVLLNIVLFTERTVGETKPFMEFYLMIVAPFTLITGFYFAKRYIKGKKGEI
jgi:hypothetical protein